MLKPEAILEELATRIRSLRERRGMTQEAFATRCGISVSFASLLERGQRSPSYETLVRVAEALETPMAELFRDANPEGGDAPYVAKLSDFAKNAQLTRPQVEKLIQVATALFDLPVHRNARSSARMPGTRCTVDGCGRAVLARGLCASHYHRQRRARASKG